MSEGGIDKSVANITYCHHEACQVMTNGDREGRIPPSHKYNMFSLAHHLIRFLDLKTKYGKGFQKFLTMINHPIPVLVTTHGKATQKFF